MIACIIHSSFFWPNHFSYLKMYMDIYQILLISSSVGEHLGYLHFLARMYNTARNIHVQVFLRTYVLITLGYLPGSRIAAPHGNCLTF